MRFTRNVLDTIGNTPLVPLVNVTKGIEPVFRAKREYFNPTGSVKDRMAHALSDVINHSQKIRCLPY